MHTEQIIFHGTQPVDIATLLAFEHNHQQPGGEAGKPDAFGKALSVVAHDLRGPLANLALIIEDISRRAEDDNSSCIARKAKNAERILDRMSGFLGAVLKRSRGGRDPLSVNFDTVNLIEVLQLAFAVNQPTARRKSVTFRCLAVDPVPMLGDAELLLEVFDNLIGNAIRYSPEGGTITCELAAAGGSAIQVKIADEGPGFQTADLMRAFRPLASYTPAPSGSKGSSGLGLWISRLITERHGGKISALNRPEGGAMMTVRLPIIPASTASP